MKHHHGKPARPARRRGRRRYDVKGQAALDNPNRRTRRRMRRGSAGLKAIINDMLTLEIRKRFDEEMMLLLNGEPSAPKVRTPMPVKGPARPITAIRRTGSLRAIRRALKAKHEV